MLGKWLREAVEAYFVKCMFTIIENAISCIGWGILFSSLGMGLFVFLIRGWYRDAVFTLASFLVALPLYVLLSIQSVLIVGAVKIINLEEYYEDRLQSIVAGAIGMGAETVTAEQSEKVLQDFISDYPLVAKYVGGGRFKGWSAEELPHAIMEELDSYMCWYIMRRLLWCLAFVVIGGVLVIRTLSKSKGRKKLRRRVYTRRSAPSYCHRRR